MKYFISPHATDSKGFQEIKTSFTRTLADSIISLPFEMFTNFLTKLYEALTRKF